MGSNLLIFLILLAITGLLYFIYIRLTDLVSLMSMLVELITPRSEQYDQEAAKKKAEDASNSTPKNQ